MQGKLNSNCTYDLIPLLTWVLEKKVYDTPHATSGEQYYVVALSLGTPYIDTI